MKVVRGMPIVILFAAVGACAAPERSVSVGGSAADSSAIVCPEGVTDTDCGYFGTAGLQAAVDDATDGASIILRAGVYNVETWSEIPFRATASAADDVFQLRAALLIDGKRLSITGEPGVVIDNLAGPPVSAIVVRNGALNLERVTISNFAYADDEDAIYDGHGVFGLDADLTIKDVLLHAVHKMSVSGRGDSHIDMERVWVRDGHVGLWLRETSTGRVREVVMSQLNVAGVANYAQTTASISNSVFVDIPDDAVYGSETASLAVRDSVFERNKPYGVHADGAATIVLSNSQFSDNQGDYREAPGARLLIQGDLIHEPSRIDEWFGAPADSVLTGAGSVTPWRESAPRASIGVSAGWSKFFRENEAAIAGELGE